jgi:bacterial condensin subunit MukE
MRASISRLRRLGMVWYMGNDSSKFRIMESVFRFGADVRSGDDAREAQLRLIRDGEAMTLENKAAANESDDADNENDVESDANDNAEDEQE